MTVIIFLVDNTPSMLQQSMLNGVRHSYINLAKRMVYSLLILRQSYEDKTLDRYMLLTYDTRPNHVKVGWKESKEQFYKALGNLQCTGSVSRKEALRNAYDLLNEHRMMVGTDTYGCGRCPSNILYSFIILITNYRNEPTIIARPVGPPQPISTEPLLTEEPFRWDQRLFAFILGSTKCIPVLEQECRKTGGWCMATNSKHHLHRGISKLLDSLKRELMVDFVHESAQRSGELPAITPHITKCALDCCSNSSNSSWPFPESFWPRGDLAELVPRLAHPKVRIQSTCCDEPVWRVAVPIDKYELRVCVKSDTALPVTDCGKVWPVEIVPIVGQEEQPFGYLKKESDKIYLYVLPYYYSSLHRILPENCGDFSVTNKQFIYTMKQYINSIPAYYCYYLRKALTGILKECVLQAILPPAKIYYLNMAIYNQLNQLREAATQSRKVLCKYVSKQQTLSTAVAKQPEAVERLNLQQLLNEEKDKDFKVHYMRPVVLPTMTERATPNYRNPYTIERSDLLDTLNRMRSTFYCPDTIAALQGNASSTTVSQNSKPMLRTSVDSAELVAEIVKYQREHPEKRIPTKRKAISVQNKIPKIKQFCLTDI